ncbi:hypothetical protein VNO77_19297 [Canavalia gladiata]|uniref:Uncharacterized protein n=1 Tax=Canavalia gladiata TaxID=3824 RepID=A0AAN9QKD4_CANGL
MEVAHNRLPTKVNLHGASLVSATTDGAGAASTVVFVNNNGKVNVWNELVADPASEDGAAEGDASGARMVSCTH